MKVTAFLIKYGEIAIKGKNRYMFEDALMKQIRHAMAPVGDFKVRKESGRMFVEAQDEFDYDEAVEALQRVFGIVGICPMVIEENKDMEHLTETVIKFIDEQYPVKDFTFKVHARRGDKQFPLDSMAINMEIGGQLLDAFEGIKVDVHHPQVMVNIEVCSPSFLVTIQRLIRKIASPMLSRTTSSLVVCSSEAASPKKYCPAVLRMRAFDEALPIFHGSE